MGRSDERACQVDIGGHRQHNYGSCLKAVT